MTETGTDRVRELEQGWKPKDENKNGNGDGSGDGTERSSRGENGDRGGRRRNEEAQETPEGL